MEQVKEEKFKLMNISLAFKIECLLSFKGLFFFFSLFNTFDYRLCSLIEYFSLRRVHREHPVVNKTVGVGVGITDL
jgi:hypothetical protein